MMMMRTILLAVILFTEVMACAQGATGVIRIRKKVSKLLCLNGYTDGAIPPHAVCGGKGLFVTNTEQYRVKSFVILVETVKEVEARVSGNVVSGDICETIAALKTGDIIYINKVVAIDNTTGQEVKLPPLKFQVRSPLVDDKKQRYRIREGENN